MDSAGRAAFFDRAAAFFVLRLAVFGFVPAVFVCGVVVVACWCELLYCLASSSAKSYRFAGMPAVERCDFGRAVDVVVVVIVVLFLPDRSRCRFSVAERANLHFPVKVVVFLSVRGFGTWGPCCIL